MDYLGNSTLVANPANIPVSQSYLAPAVPASTVRRTYTLSDLPTTTTTYPDGTKKLVVEDTTDSQEEASWHEPVAHPSDPVRPDRGDPVLHPSFDCPVHNLQTNELYVDWGKLILWSLGIAIVVVLLLWVLKGVIGYEMSYWSRASVTDRNHGQRLTIVMALISPLSGRNPRLPVGKKSKSTALRQDRSSNQRVVDPILSLGGSVWAVLEFSF